MSRAKKPRKAYKPGRRPGDGIKLKMQPWKVQAVLNPLEAIITQLERDGTIDVAPNDQAIFKDAIDGHWYHSATAIAGVVEAYEIHERRTGLDLQLEGLHKLAKLLEYGMPVNASQTDAARVSLKHIRAASMDMTAGYARNLIVDFQIMEELQHVKEAA